jgi:hypothetical protein
MALRDVVGKLARLDREATIYAQEPWTPDSPSLLRVQDPEAEYEPIVIDGHRCLLEVSIARDVVETYATWCADERRTPTHADEVRAVLHYATHDAYLPLHEAPQLPTATVGGFTLHVSHIKTAELAVRRTSWHPTGARFGSSGTPLRICSSIAFFPRKERRTRGGSSESPVRCR